MIRRLPSLLILSLILFMSTPGLALASDLAERTITGVVTDDNGEPLIGANIVVKEKTTIGTITDFDGKFSLTIPDNATALLVSYIGHISKEVSLTDKSKYKIILREDAAQLDEVIVVGYGETKKSDVIGAVDLVTAKQIEAQPITNYTQALAGQVAGLQVRQGTGQPGGAPEILIRGINSFSSQSAPLIVIDGIAYGNYNAETNNFLTMLNPEDIESLSVVRDASGKAIYGSRASNGLILIKTKRGRVGKPTIEFSTYAALQTIPSWEVPNVMNATELATFHRERFIDDYIFQNGVAPTEDQIPQHVRNPEQYGEGTDWFDAVTQNGQQQNYNLALRGGSENFKYSISLNHLNQEGIVIETDLQRYAMRINLDADINPWLHLGVELAPSWTNNSWGNTDPGGGQFSVYNTLNVARWADPTGTVYDENGELTRDTKGALTEFFMVNPVRRLKEQKLRRQNRQALAGARLRIDLPKNFTFETYAGTVYINNRGNEFRPASTQPNNLTPSFQGQFGQAATGRYENIRLVSENTLKYNSDFGGSKHSLDGLLGYTAEFTRETFFSGNANRLIDENFELFASGNVPISDPATPDETQIFFGANESFSEQALVSYLGRIAYNFDERYYFTGTIRTDGSSRFGPDNRFGTFPSAGVAWRASRESFFPRGGVVSNLKFEGSWGLSGNNRIGNYTYQGRVGGSDYVLGGARVDGLAITGLPNPDLAWEETEQLDIGVDIGLFKDRLNIEVDYFRTTTTGLLSSFELPRITGFGSRLENLGTLENNGVEFAVFAQPVVRDKFIWSIDGNVSVLRNKILKLGENDIPRLGTNGGNGVPVSISQVGSPIGLWLGLDLQGLYTPEMIDDDAVPKYQDGGSVVGAPFYTDVDGNGVLDRGREDRVIIGNPWPDFTFGFNQNFSYGNWSLRINAYGEVGSQILDLSREFMQNTDLGGANAQTINGDRPLGVFNLDREQINRFRVGDTDYSVRPPTTVTQQSSQRWRWVNNSAVKNGTFFKINNITLTYKFTDLLAGVPQIRGGSVYFSVQNAFVFSSYDGNPEIRRAGGGFLERNVNYSAYPVPRTYTLGLNVSL